MAEDERRGARITLTLQTSASTRKTEGQEGREGEREGRKRKRKRKRDGKQSRKVLQGVGDVVIFEMSGWDGGASWPISDERQSVGAVAVRLRRTKAERATGPRTLKTVDCLHQTLDNSTVYEGRPRFEHKRAPQQIGSGSAGKSCFSAPC